MKRWLVPGFFLGLVVVAGGLGFLFGTSDGRLYRQELASLVAGKGKERALARFQQRLEILGKNREALNLRVVVRKAAHRLLLCDGDQVLATFPVGLGRNPVGQKESLHDNRTPEGEYFVCYRKEASRYHLFLGLTYPNPDDAARALGAGLITATEAEAILDAGMKKERPPWNTALGGPFGLHGYGADEDWTEGTLALANGHIEELFWNLPDGTSVVVEP